MMNLTLGLFDSPIDDSARNAVFQCLQPLRAQGFSRGTASIRIDDTQSVRVTIESRDEVMLKLVDRILDKVIDDGSETLASAGFGSAHGALLAAAWRAMAAVRSSHYRHGRHQVDLEGGQILEFTIGRWDAALIEQCDEFLYRTYRENWWKFNSLLARSTAAGALRVALVDDARRAA